MEIISGSTFFQSVISNQVILLVHGWHAMFKALYFFCKRLMILLHKKCFFYNWYSFKWRTFSNCYSFLRKSLVANLVKHDIKNPFRQITQLLSICFQWNTSHTDLRVSNCVWLEQLNVCIKYELLSDKNVSFIR